VIGSNGNLLAYRYDIGSDSISRQTIAEYTPDERIQKPINWIFMDGANGKVARILQESREPEFELEFFDGRKNTQSPPLYDPTRWSLDALVRWAATGLLKQLIGEGFSFPIFEIAIDMYGSLLIGQYDSALDGSAASLRVILQNGPQWNSLVHLIHIEAASGKVVVTTVAEPDRLR
jgi:hypothetical protein